MPDSTNARKIFELRGKGWMNGISFQASSIQDGIFQQATNFDPFEVTQILQPARVSTQYNSVAIVKQIQYFANFTKSNLPYMYGFAGQGSTTAMYEIKATDGTIVDVSAQITTTASARGLIAWADPASATRGLVYATDTTVRANSIPVAIANDLEILTGLTSAEHKFEKGADGNLYFTNGNKLGKIVITTGTTGNTGAVFTFDQNLTLRDIANDGRYLVIIADDQTGTDQLGTYNCMIAYWDYTSGTLAQRYDLKLNSMRAVKIMGGNAHVFGNDGIYVCNVATYPKLLFPFNSVFSGVYPRSTALVVKRGTNVILWGDGNSGAIYGYGSQGIGDKNIMFHLTTVNGTLSALGIQGISSSVYAVFAGTTDPALYIQGISTTRNESVLRTVSIVLAQPYRLKFIRLVTRNVLASGETVSITINSQNGSSLPSNAQTFSFTGNGAKQSCIFYPYLALTQSFNEFDLTIDSTKAAVQSVEIWGEPLDILDQSI